MNTYLYAVCPHCEHPNVHVHNGNIAEHTVSLASSTKCSGSGLEAKETHSQTMNRHTEEYRQALARWEDVPFKEPDDIRPTFKTWEFSGLQFIAVPVDRGNVHIADCIGNNYGSWMTVEEFRKRQKAGRIEDWKSLGKCHLQVINER